MANKYLNTYVRSTVYFMQELKIKAYAKINLTLDVLGKRSDGYHELATIMQTIDLADVLTFKEKERGISIVTSSMDIPTDEKNLAYQAAQLFLEKNQLATGVEITLEKQIPVMAGLAGGSSDAAATLLGLKKLWDLPVSQEELWQMAVQLGSDVAFCLKGGTCLAQGRGEILTPLLSPPPLWLVVVKPKLAVSTAWVYQNLDLLNIQERPDNEVMIRALAKGEVEEIAGCLGNVLETVTLPSYPILGEIKERMKALGALGVLMSGSGPTLFGFTASQGEAEIIARALEGEMERVFVTTTLGSRKEVNGERGE